METLDSSNHNGTPLTEEQLAYFSESNRRTVTHALHRARRAAVAGFLILLIGVGYNLHYTSQQSDQGREAIVHSGRVVSVAGCNRDFHTINTLRGVLIGSKRFQAGALKRGDITQDQFDRASDYYDAQLVKLVLPDCRKARAVLTDDPNQLVPIPQPLFVPTKKGNG